MSDPKRDLDEDLRLAAEAGAPVPHIGQHFGCRPCTEFEDAELKRIGIRRTDMFWEVGP